MNRLLFLLPPALLLWGLTGLFTVDQAEFAYVTQFGRPVATLDGATDAGLHVNLPWPIQSVQRLARRAYGIEVVDVRLRRFNYPSLVRPAIAERIISERNKKVADYQSEGARRAADVASAAEREARTILADARAEEQRIKKQADVDADAVRNQAHSQDREFYAFLQKLEAYQRILGDTRDVLLLSGKHELFD